MSKIVSFDNEAFAGIEQIEHLLVLLLLECTLREEGINKIHTFLQHFFYSAHVHNMKSCVGFIHAYYRKMIGKEIVHITRISLLAIEDFRLVLLIGSTEQQPEFVLRQLFLTFLGTAVAAWTQKERARN